MKHKIFLVFALIFMGLNVCLAQSSTGINTSSPNPKAALDINATSGLSQGLFIPRLKTADRPAFNPLTNVESGLMFYDIDKDSIFYWTGTNWVSLMVNKAGTGSPVTGTGTLNSVARWSSASTLGTGILKDNGSKVFIGAETGIGLLNINNAGPSSLGLNNTTSSVAMALVTGYTDLKNKFEFTNDLYFSGVTYSAIGIGADPTNYVVVKNNGNVGIGIAAPAARLHVSSVSQLNTILESSSTVGTWLPIGNTSVGGKYFHIISSGSTNGEGPGKLLFGTGTSAGTTTIAMTIDNTLNVGIGTSAPLANLSVAGTGTQMVHIGDVFSGNYAGITLNGTIADGSYNFLSSAADQTLLINRPTGNSIQFRENNTTSLTLNPVGDNIARVAHMNLTSANTWGTAINIANTSSGGSTYTIASTGTSHPLGKGSFVVQDLSTNYAFVLNSLTRDTHLSCTLEGTTNVPATSCVGIGYDNPNVDLAGNQKLQVNGRILSRGNDISSDLRYKNNIYTIKNTLSDIHRIRGVYHHWRVHDFPEHAFTNKQQIGFIAQEIEAVYPQLVSTDNNGYKSVDYARITPILLQAIKEMDSLISIQNQRINELKTENESIRKDVNSILDRLQLKVPGKTSQLLPEIK